MGRLLCCSTLGLSLCLALVAPPVGAQPPDDEEDALAATADESGPEETDEDADAAKADGADDAKADGADDAAEEEDDEADEGGDDEPARKRDDLDPYEDPLVGHHFLGMRFRDFIVPQFIMELFAEGGATTNVMSIGPEYVYRRDNLQYNVSISYADYSMDSILFKGHDDGPTAYERVWSNLKALYLTIDIMYEVPFGDGMGAFLIGGGVGLAGVFGNLYRHQVYPNAGNDPTNPSADNLDTWNDCTGPNNPGIISDPNPAANPNHPYCDSDNDHYPAADGSPYSEPSWANGGSKPFLFPYLSIPQISFRFKPIKYLNTRFDAGFALTGFYLGLAAHYGFPAE